jgi:hypothetical protein
MPARRFERIALDLMLGGCAVMFGACVLIEHAQAQPGYVPPPTPLPPPILNPSSRYRTSTELPAHHADNTEHSTFNTKRGSKS